MPWAADVPRDRDLDDLVDLLDRRDLDVDRERPDASVLSEECFDLFFFLRLLIAL